ncbi:helix-turn-helix domain-containing protein [Lactococcus garvieae]|uniref:helix-turn-helix domain-containing protein n=1 Tax=Lactococcus garvieae TaxID=1363 RepID=UPI00254EBD85|nr:helix-turn-helix transcriptional regulator [Lactococcus garvieae]
MTQENLISKKLRVLIAENRVRASHVSNDTGIAKSTLSRLVNGESKGIEFKTIEKLCKYFGIEPRDLFTPSKERGK